MAFNDPRSCLRSFLETGRNIGRRPPSLSLRNIQRDIRSVKTRIENVKDRLEGAIGAAVRGEFLPGQFFSILNEFRCPPTPYQRYFSENRPPNFKFMFFVSMELNPSFKVAFGQPWANGEMWWFIKQSGRPNVTYDYEEVNMYNFRQKVLRRATLNPVQIQIYDDIADVSASFWNTFLRIQSPVTSLNPTSTQQMMESSGMNWGDGKEIQRLQTDLGQVRTNLGYPADQPVLNYGASTGVLPGREETNTQIIKEINVYHLIDWGRKFVRYQYVNPRINYINFDELTWESSEPSTIDVEFEYDTFHMYFPNTVSENLFQGDRIPPIYTINPNTSFMQSPFVAKGIDKFDRKVQSVINRGKQAVGSSVRSGAQSVASSVPGFGKVSEGFNKLRGFV